MQVPNIPCLFKHAARDTFFTLVVDDFLVKYSTTDDATHFTDTLKLLYEIKVDRTASKYLGYSIAFDDPAQTVSLSMPEYIPKLLQRFSPGRTIRGPASPATPAPHTNGAAAPAEPIDHDSPPLTPDQKLRLQEIVGSFLYYARAVDCTMLTAVNHIASEQSRGTQHVIAIAERLLSYAASYPAHALVYRACEMILHIQTDASFLSRSNSRSVAGGILYCDNAVPLQHSINGAILTIIGGIPTSAIEAEYAAAYMSAKEGFYCRHILEALG
jgi:hypothetical protein